MKSGRQGPDCLHSIKPRGQAGIRECASGGRCGRDDDSQATIDPDRCKQVRGLFYKIKPVGDAAPGRAHVCASLSTAERVDLQPVEPIRRIRAGEVLLPVRHPVPIRVGIRIHAYRSEVQTFPGIRQAVSVRIRSASNRVRLHDGRSIAQADPAHVCGIHRTVELACLEVHFWRAVRLKINPADVRAISKASQVPLAIIVGTIISGRIVLIRNAVSRCVASQMNPAKVRGVKVSGAYKLPDNRASIGIPATVDPAGVRTVRELI